MPFAAAAVIKNGAVVYMNCSITIVSAYTNLSCYHFSLSSNEVASNGRYWSSVCHVPAIQRHQLPEHTQSS